MPTYNQLFVAEIILAALLVPLLIVNMRTGHTVAALVNAANVVFLVALMRQNRQLKKRYPES